MSCLNCGKELEQIPNKREKKFCNSTCRSNYWQKEKVKNKLKFAKSVPEKKDFKQPLEPKDMVKATGNTYGFNVNDKWFFVEKYTKHPTKDIPANKVDAQRWLREKTYSDNEIKKAWNEWKVKQV